MQVGLVALRQFFVGEPPKPFGLHPLRLLADVVARHEVVQVRRSRRVGFQREALVGVQVVDPQFPRPRISLAGLRSKSSSTSALTS